MKIYKKLAFELNEEEFKAYLDNAVYTYIKNVTALQDYSNKIYEKLASFIKTKLYIDYDDIEIDDWLEEDTNAEDVLDEYLYNMMKNIIKNKLTILKFIVSDTESHSFIGNNIEVFRDNENNINELYEGYLDSGEFTSILDTNDAKIIVSLK